MRSVQGMLVVGFSLALASLAGCLDPESTLEPSASAASEPGPWPEGKTEIVLFDGTVATTQTCYAPFTLPAGVLIIEGTKRLRVSADASDALKAGQYHFDLELPRGEWKPYRDTDEKIQEWVVELGPRDWDRPGSAESRARPSFECSHDSPLPWPYGPGVLEGTIETRIVAERADPDS